MLRLPLACVVCLPFVAACMAVSGCGGEPRAETQGPAAADSAAAAETDQLRELLLAPTPDELAVALATMPEGTEPVTIIPPGATQPSAIGFLLAGDPIGEWRYYHNNGAIAMFGTYRAGGVKQGEWQMFDTNGQRTSVGAFDRDNEHGRWTWFYPSGGISMQGLFVNGERHGEWVLRHPNGALSARGFYGSGSQAGRWVYYDTDGNPTSDVRFHQPGTDWPDGLRR